MNCIFYDRILEKKVPCLLLPGRLTTVEDKMCKKIFVQVQYDSSKFVEYNITVEELDRYSSEFVNIHDIYPANTQAQIDYSTAVIPNKVTNDSDELDRYEAIIEMITTVNGDISKDIFYRLSDFVSYELLFQRCTYNERLFMMSLSVSELTEQPVQIFIPQMVRMTKRLFEKYTTTIDSEYDIDNYNNYYEYENTLPITLNINNLKYNVNFIII